MNKQVALAIIHTLKGALSAVVPIVTVAGTKWSDLLLPGVVLGAILGGVSALTAYMDTTIRPMRKDDTTRPT